MCKRPTAKLICCSDWISLECAQKRLLFFLYSIGIGLEKVNATFNELIHGFFFITSVFFFSRSLQLSSHRTLNRMTWLWPKIANTVTLFAFELMKVFLPILRLWWALRHLLSEHSLWLSSEVYRFILCVCFFGRYCLLQCECNF